jgi:hypothetical protein
MAKGEGPEFKPQYCKKETKTGKEDKLEELDQIVKDHERVLRKYEWNV